MFWNELSGGRQEVVAEQVVQLCLVEYWELIAQLRPVQLEVGDNVQWRVYIK